MKFIWLFLCLFINLNITEAQTVNILNHKIHLNSIIQLGHYYNAPTRVIHRYTMTSLKDCIEKCKYIAGCEFVVYRRMLQICEPIFTTDPTTRIVREEIGTLYGNKSEWDITTVPTFCESCSPYSECRPGPAPSCVSQGCARPFIKGTTKFGNVYNINSKIMIECNKVNMSVTKVCQENEEWSHENFTCTLPAPVCESEVNYFETTLNDSTTFNYYLSLNTSTKEDAINFCNTNCGRLVQIVTMPKYTFLANLVAYNPAYNDDFMIDGAYDISRDKWFTSDDEEISKDIDFWDDPSSYDGAMSAHCLFIDGRDYKLEDTDCESEYRFICEQV